MSYKTKQGRFKPRNPGKYKGDPSNIIYRSSWEKKFMLWCDCNLNVLEWGSEEIVIPYRSPLDRRVHRYFPDFMSNQETRTVRPSRDSLKLNLMLRLKHRN